MIAALVTYVLEKYSLSKLLKGKIYLLIGEKIHQNKMSNSTYDNTFQIILTILFFAVPKIAMHKYLLNGKFNFCMKNFSAIIFKKNHQVQVLSIHIFKALNMIILFMICKLNARSAF